MNLKDVKPSTHYEDIRRYVDPAEKSRGLSLLDLYANHQDHKNFHEFYKTTTHDEKVLMNDHGFSPEDIYMMRALRQRGIDITPEQVTMGWSLLRPGYSDE